MGAKGLKPGEAGVDIQIPIKVQFETFMRGMHDLASGNYAEVLEGIAKAEKEIEMQWAAYAGNAEEKKLNSGTLRCAFVLEPMLADFIGLATGRAFISMSQRNAKAVENLMLNNLWFSLLEIDLSIERTDAVHELEARKSTGLLLRSLLDSKSRAREDAHISYHFDCPSTIQVSQLQAFKLMCDATMPAKDFEAMCSALVLARTTKKLALELEISSWDHNNRANWWKWLAYGLFSKRARACSSLRACSSDPLFQSDGLGSPLNQTRSADRSIR